MEVNQITKKSMTAHIDNFDKKASIIHGFNYTITINYCRRNNSPLEKGVGGIAIDHQMLTMINNHLNLRHVLFCL